jgi:RimJ/RimL family protein N-acetyltransferase
VLPDLSTPRLTLRSACASDLDALRQLWDDAAVRRFLFDDTEVTHERARTVLDGALAVADRGLGLWWIESRDDGRVGCIGLVPTMLAQYEPTVAGLAEPIVALAPVHWHRGFAVEALGIVVRYAFESLALDRIAAAADVPNVASRRMLERAGFRELGERDGPRYRMMIYLFERC